MARSASHPTRHAFSLMELMLVVLILGILMAVVTYNIVGQGAKAQDRATKVSLSTLKGAVETYHLENSTYPPNLAWLVQIKVIDDKSLQDAWKHDFLYDPRGNSADQPYILGSAGPDGQQGTADDIDAWTMNKTPQVR